MSDAPLTGKHLRALQATARSEVFRTYHSTAFTITGPCSSKLLWSLAREGLIADPPDGPLPGCHCMVVTAKGLAARNQREFPAY
jgi:hypothetical protein